MRINRAGHGTGGAVAKGALASQLAVPTTIRALTQPMPCHGMHRMKQMMAAGSAFDNLGMPTIRPRGSTGEENRAEETPAVTEVAPVSK